MLVIIDRKGWEEEIDLDPIQKYGLSELEEFLEMIWSNALNLQINKLKPKKYKWFAPKSHES